MAVRDSEHQRVFKLSERSKRIEPFHVMEILRLANSLEQGGQKVIHLELGEPSFASPEPVVEAGRQALKAGLTQYTRAIGIDALRQAVANYYQQQMNVDLDWHRVAITAGASSGLLMALAALLDNGDSLLLSDPGYPCYPNYAELLGVKVRYMALQESQGFKLDRAILEQYWQADSKAVLLASPANPTGARIALNDLANMAEFVRARHGALLVDEIYQGLNYGSNTRLESVLQVADDAIVINSFSKFFGMTGWRIGWSVLPEGLMPTMEKLAQNLTISPATLSQYAAIAAFSAESLAIAEQRRQAFEVRRNYLLGELRRLDFGIAVEPEGAFYIYANVENFSQDSFEFCQHLLTSEGVAVTPGLDFSLSHHKRFVRFSYTANMEQLQEAVFRIERFLKSRR